MSSKIYYFSGTGNSLAVARELSKDLNDTTSIIPISFNEEEIIIEEDAVGFVFPVYYLTVPEVIQSFIDKIQFKSKPYVFAVATCNGLPGVSLYDFKKYLSNKDISLACGFSVAMTGCASFPSKKVKEIRLKTYKLEVKKIADIINRRGTNEIHYNPIKSLGSYLCKKVAKNFYITASNTSITSECTGCGICEKICPLQNISIKDNIPVHGDNCCSCLACYHWCPKKAVRGGVMINNKEQFHNPDILLKDMIIK